MRVFPDISLILLVSLLTASPHPDLTGRWRINISRSDDAFTMLKFDTTGAPQRPANAGGGGGGGSRPGGGFGGRGIGGGGGMGGMGRRRGGGAARGDSGPPMSETQRLAFRQALRFALYPPPLLQIAETDSTVTFGTDPAALVLGDGKTMVVPAVDSIAEVTITSRWIGNAFLVSRQVAGGGKVSEDYVKAADGTQLTVFVHFDGGQERTLDFRRVYDLVAN
ncbi:MAG TPA: hypothetical protein VN674_13575 [Gemmatimonadales bacterium]|nr:hypothetical protein [Gemmatimonadales bacterium]